MEDEGGAADREKQRKSSEVHEDRGCRRMTPRGLE